MAASSRLQEDPFGAQGEQFGDCPEVHVRLRQAGPVVEVEAPAGGQAFIVTDYELARRVLADTRFAKDPALAPAHWHGRDPGLEPPAAAVRALTTLDGPDHQSLRRVHAPAFTRRRLEAQRNRIAAMARELLTDLSASSIRNGLPAELSSNFTMTFPLAVICDLLGVPDLDLAKAVAASEALSRGDPQQALAGMANLEVLVAAAIRARRDDRVDTMTEILTDRARAEFGDISDAELLYMISGLIFAGQVTTDSFLGFLLAVYLSGGLDLAGQDTQHTERQVFDFVSEALRLYPPVPFTLWRFATEPTAIDGWRFPAGAPVLIDIEGVNTDPRRFTDPLTFNTDRARLPDLTFGDGRHVCIGAQLALLEAVVVVEVLREDFPNATLAQPAQTLPRDRPGTQTRRLLSIPVWLTGPPHHQP